MSGQKNGGPAFPRRQHNSRRMPDGLRIQGHTGHPGMTMRQWYKSQALIGILASGPHDCNIRELVYEAGQYADAMIAEDQSQ